MSSNLKTLFSLFGMCLCRHTVLGCRQVTLICISALTCTHWCKGMRILRSHLVPVLRLLSAAPHPSKKRSELSAFPSSTGGFLFSPVCLQDGGRKASVRPEQSTRLFTNGQLRILRSNAAKSAKRIFQIALSNVGEQQRADYSTCEPDVTAAVRLLSVSL